MTNSDPFGDDDSNDLPPWEQVDNRPADKPAEKAEVKVASNTARPESNDNTGVSVTFKGGTGFDAPWIVLHAATVADALAQANDKTLGELIERAAKVGAHFASLGSKSTGRTPAPAAGAGAPDPKAAPGGEVKTCRHGEMVFKSGFNEEKGKAWSGHFCPQPKGSDQCDPVWPRKR